MGLGGGRERVEDDRAQAAESIRRITATLLQVHFDMQYCAVIF